MEKNRDGIGSILKREVCRIILERFQGASVNHAMDREMQEDDPDMTYEVEEILNQPYMNRQEVPLAMDIFKPKVKEGKELPVIVTIHGGGLVMGDRKISRRFAKSLAGRGYLVFSVEYRLAPRANCAEQLDDVCAGMDLIGRELVNFDVDFTRVFLIAESAGAYLATYVTAMRGSKKLQDAIGYKPSRMVFKGVGLVCGMFYTQKRDPIGMILSDQFYGDKRDNEEFIKYMDPENPEIIDNLPPAILITSRGDFLNNYTLMFHDALKKAGKRTKLLYYGDEALTHAFVTMQPSLDKSKDAIEKMLNWFEAEADVARGKAAPKAAPKPAAKAASNKTTAPAKAPAKRTTKKTTTAKASKTTSKTAAKPAAKATTKPAAKPAAKTTTKRSTSTTKKTTNKQ